MSEHHEAHHDHARQNAWQNLPHDTPNSIVAALGGREAFHASVADDPVRVILWKKAVAWARRGKLALEDGSERAIDGELPADLPLGYHTFVPDDESAVDGSAIDGNSHHSTTTVRVIVTPGKCPLPEKKTWGWAVQLHSSRSAESWGFGDLADLRRLASWSASLGAGVMLVNPIVASAPTLPQNASPYYPTTRRFRNPLYLRIEEVPGAQRLGPELERLANEGKKLNERYKLERDCVFELKQEALQAIWAGFQGDLDFDRFCREQGPSLERFGLYCALAKRHGADWRGWPEQFRRLDSAGSIAFAREHANEIRYHQWLQWLLDKQLAGTVNYVSLVQDLPIGMDPGGADAWEWQDLVATSMTVGAPPDAFNADGQNWALPPFIPTRLRAAGYEPFIQTIRATLRHAQGLRIDHVMGLFRLWWIPEGEHAQRGWYVRYPADDLLGILALEAHRAGAFVVGEDLGTVEPGVREQLARRNILSCRLLWFEPTPPREYPELALTSATTHDLPTIAGLWSGADAAAQQAIGMPNSEEITRLRRHIQQLLEIDDHAAVEDVIVTAYKRLAESPSRIILATLEDAQAMVERPNMPGTIQQWPNWSIALTHDIATMEKSELPRRIAEVLARR